MSRGPDKEVRERCPRCRLSDIYKRLTQVYYCKQCAFEFKTPVVGQRYAEAKGSGVVAGKIEIGRGFNWKAGY